MIAERVHLLDVEIRIALREYGLVKKSFFADMTVLYNACNTIRLKWYLMSHQRL